MPVSYTHLDVYKRQVCNFDTVAHDKFKVGVPFAGRYKEILNSDAKEFGGLGRVNIRAKASNCLLYTSGAQSADIDGKGVTINVIFIAVPQFT